MYKKELDKIKKFAAECHQGQVRKGSGIPYIVHPARVASILQDNINLSEKFNFITQGIAWLHDVVEDCISYDTLRIWMYENISDDSCRIMILRGVRCLTEDKSIHPRNERHKAYIKQLSEGVRTYRIVKLADRIDNLRDGGLDKGFLKNVYLKESKDILRICNEKDGCNVLILTLSKVIKEIEKRLGNGI